MSGQGKNVKVRVVTVNMDTMNVERSEVIMHNHPKKREWLSKHMHWALRNNRGVQVSPYDPEED